MGVFSSSQREVFDPFIHTSKEEIKQKKSYKGQEQSEKKEGRKRKKADVSTPFFLIHVILSLPVDHHQRCVRSVRWADGWMAAV